MKISYAIGLVAVSVIFTVAIEESRISIAATRTTMPMIDAVLTKHGGFPAAFAKYLNFSNLPFWWRYERT